MPAHESITRRHRLDRVLQPFRRRRGLTVAPNLPSADRDRIAKEVEQLLAQPETTAQRVAAARLVAAYRGLDADGHGHFLDLLASRFGTDPAAIDRAAASLQRASTPTARARAERDLRQAVVPRYAALLHVITGLADGVGFLVDLRADVLARAHDDATLGSLEDELTGHLATLFDVGLLDLRQITWDSPASVLDRLMETEAVHEIHGWEDLRHRLAGDQRCYGFFHPALPNEPIVFVEVALTHGLADNLPHLLEREDAVDDADTAIFYSITSAQPGLAGVHLGNELIKQVVDELRRTDDDLKHFATLSPLPGYRSWLRSEVKANALLSTELEAFGPELDAIVDGDDSWVLDPALAERLRPGVLSTAARYLMTTRDGRARDSVANFHLSNGASLERLNWLANPAHYGIEQSLGVMVNYLYDRSKIAANAGSYLTEGSIKTSNHVKNLVKTPKR
ncbi:MAG: malonyl-CoA decarboxylase family protein [Acidimicrobiia bacterium]